LRPARGRYELPFILNSEFRIPEDGEAPWSRPGDARAPRAALHSELWM